MFCLDTNVVIAAITGRSKLIVDRLEAEFEHRTRVLLPTVVLYELRFGVAKSARRVANARVLDAFLTAPVEILSFDGEDASEAADIRAHLFRKGTPIGPYDMLIAAQARRRGASLVSANFRAFQRVPGLVTQDWATL